MDGLAAEDDPVGVVDGRLGQVNVGSVFIVFEILDGDARKLHFFVEAATQGAFETVVIDRIDDFRLVEQRVVFVGALDQDGHQGREPAVAMDDVGRPVLLANRFDDAAVEEDGAVVVVFAELAVVVVQGSR